MGIQCIKTEPSMQKSTSFTYQNMIKYISSGVMEDSYEILELLGQGTFSEVFKGKNRQTGNIRAIKKIDRKKHSKIEPLLLNQFDILKEMDHPNILKMYEIYQEYQFFYIITELCTGKELFDVISEVKCFTEMNAAKIFYQLISACRYLHEKKVMHRDLKPENIIYNIQTNTFKLVDFGSAVRFDTKQPSHRRRIGTSYYIAPEVLERNYNHKCDVWSSGIILYILLCGQPPFKGENDQEILKNIKNGNFTFKKPIWDEVSAEAKLLITEMLDRDIDKRPEMLEIMENQWLKKCLNSQQSFDKQAERNLKCCLKNMKKFKDMKSSSIEGGFLVFMINFIKDGKDQAEMIKSFQTLDLDGDGVISVEELKVGLSEYLDIGTKEALSIAKAIFKKVDTNDSGFIDYSQFVIAASNMEMMVTEENLELAFDCMDKDKNGSLSVQEIRERLGDNISSQTYTSLLKQYKKNPDGQISKKQFIQMMKKLLKQN